MKLGLPVVALWLLGCVRPSPPPAVEVPADAAVVAAPAAPGPTPPLVEAAACAAPVVADASGPPEPTRPASPSATSYRVRLVDERLHDLPTFVRRGRTYVLGASGDRYSIVVSNPTEARVEAVISVDGVDVFDGEGASFAKRGYVLAAHADYTVDGFRTSPRTIATFRFSSVADSYAARTGKPRDVGVIGVAFFPERKPDPEPPVDRRPARMKARMPRRAPLEFDFDQPMPAPAAPTPPATSLAPAPPPHPLPASAQDDLASRPGLGTAFGEERESFLGGGTSFIRATERPVAVLSLRYDDRRGLAALGVDAGAPPPLLRESELRESADPFRGGDPQVHRD